MLLLSVGEDQRGGGGMPSLREMQLWWWPRTSEGGIALSQLTWGCSKVTWPCPEFLSQVTSAILFGLTTSEDMLRKRNISQYHSCVEHKRQTKRKQVNRRILKKTTLTWWQIHRYTDLSKGNQKRSRKENGAADSNRGNLHFWVLRRCVVHRSWNVWWCT